MADTHQLKRRVERRWANRATWESDWQTLADYTLPRKSNITRVVSPGQKETNRLFDSTGVRAPELLAASLAGVLTSPAQQWFSLTMRQAPLNENKEVRDWLEAVAKQTYLSLNQSNFVSEIAEVYLDLAVFGTGAMLIEERTDQPGIGWQGFRFKAVSCGEYTIAEGPDGLVDSIDRRFKMDAKAVVQKWGDKAPKDVQEMLENRPDHEVEICHSVYPRQLYAASKRDARNMRWASVYFTWTKAHELSESGFQEFPYVVPRWTKNPGEIYGRGPGHTALPDIRTLNRLRELTLIAGAKNVDPPLLVLDDGIIGNVSLEPASLNVIREIGALAPLQSASKFDVAEYLDNNLKQSITGIFFADVLRLRERPGMTATEVLALQEEMLRLLGPTAGRLHSELLSPIIQRAIAVQIRAGGLPPVPMVLRMQDADVDVEYEGPLARAQKAQDLVAIERTQNYRAAVRPWYPEVDDLFDGDKEAKLYAEISGVPSDLLRGPDQVQALRNARAMAKQAIAKIQAIQGLAKGFKEGAQGAKALTEAGGNMADQAAPEGAAA